MTSLRKQLENIADALNRHVVPALNDDYAKGQGIAIVDIILDIAKRADWSLDYLSELWAAQVAATSRLTEAFEKAGAVLPCSFDATVEPWSTGQALKERIEATDQAFCDLLDAAARPDTRIPADVVNSILRDYMSEETRIELSFSHHPGLREITKNQRG